MPTHGFKAVDTSALGQGDSVFYYWISLSSSSTDVVKPSRAGGKTEATKAAAGGAGSAAGAQVFISRYQTASGSTVARCRKIVIADALSPVGHVSWRYLLRKVTRP